MESQRSTSRSKKSRSAQNKNITAIEWIEEPSDADEQHFHFRRNSTMRKTADETSILTSMSFAALQIPECKPADGEQDIDRRSFELWRDILEASMNFSNITDESTKMSVFRMKAGAKLIDVLENTVSNAKAPEEELLPYSNVMYRLREFYGSRDYVLLQRQKLRSMSQNIGETDVTFVKRVAAVAKLCDYGSEKMMETVADVVQSHALNVKVREAARKIMRKGGSITELLDKVRSAEIERQSEELYTKNHQQETVSVAAVSYATANYGQSPNYRGRGNFYRARGGLRSRGALSRVDREHYGTRLSCWRCGSNFHLPHNCHAIDKICRRCQIKGHIERACTSASTNLTKRAASGISDFVPDSKIRKITATVDEVNQNDAIEEEKKPVSELN